MVCLPPVTSPIEILKKSSMHAYPFLGVPSLSFPSHLAQLAGCPSFLSFVRRDLDQNSSALSDSPFQL